MVHAHSRWIAEPLNINTTMDVEVGMSFGHDSPRRIHPESPLWQFYLARSAPNYITVEMHSSAIIA